MMQCKSHVRSHLSMNFIRFGDMCCFMSLIWVLATIIWANLTDFAILSQRNILQQNHYNLWINTKTRHPRTAVPDDLATVKQHKSPKLFMRTWIHITKVPFDHKRGGVEGGGGRHHAGWMSKLSVNIFGGSFRVTLVVDWWFLPKFWARGGDLQRPFTAQWIKIES